MRKAAYTLLPFALYTLLPIALVRCAHKQPSLFESKPSLLTRQVTSEELKRFKESYDRNPVQYSQEYGEKILSRITGKNLTFGSQLAELPDLNDGIAPQEAEALEVIDRYTDDVKFPADFASIEKLNRPKPAVKEDIFNYHVEITWTTNKNNNGNIKIIDPLDKMIVKKVTPIGFEPDDKIESVSPSGIMTGFVLIKIVSARDQNDKNRIDEDGIWIKYSASPRHYINVAIGGGYDIKTLSVTSNNSQPQNKVAILEQMTLGGLINNQHRYSPPLEALFWQILDGKFNADTFPEFYMNSRASMQSRLRSDYSEANDSLFFTLRVWDNMEGPRWSDFKKVTSRLNLPELVDYYINKKIKYIRDPGPTKTPYLVFSYKFGDCDDLAAFGNHALRKAGYKTFGVRVYNSRDDAHIGLGLKWKGKYYLVVNFDGPVNKMSGPYDSSIEIDRALGYGSRYFYNQPFIF